MLEEKIMNSLNNKIQGHVKIEKFKDGNVIETIENHNIAVDNATDIIADSLSHPNSKQISSMEFNADTESFTTNDKYFLKDNLPYHRAKLLEFDVSLSNATSVSEDSTKKSEIKLNNEHLPVEEIQEAILTDNSSTTESLEVGKEIFVVDKEKGILGFSEDLTESEYVGTYSDIKIKLYQTVNSATSIKPNSETVKVGSTVYTRATKTDTDGRLKPTADENEYGIDYKTGEVWFAEVHENPSADGSVTITYDYTIAYGINFMSIGDKPDSHPKGYPVVLNDSQSHLSSLRNEYEGTRQPLEFPANITNGSYETLGFEAGAGTSTGSGEIFKIHEKFIPLLELDKVVVYEEGTPVEYTIVEDFNDSGNEAKIQDKDNGEVELRPSPTEPSSSGTNNVRITFKWDSGSTVNFVAEFKPTTPQPVVTNNVVTKTGTSSGVNVVYMDHDVMSIENAELNGESLTAGEDLSVDDSDMTKINLNTAITDEDSLEIEYEYEKTKFEIYEVGLFNGADESAKMFSISGIGPITKSQDTGMRITWSITF